MKKLLGTLMLSVIFCGTSQAYYYNNETNAVNTLKGEGYSEATLVVLDKVNKYNGGINSSYKPVYTKKEPQNQFSKAYTYLKNYVDPMQDDGTFAESQITFTNSWNNDLPSYAFPYNKATQKDNL